jgi:hypothetical protein
VIIHHAQNAILTDFDPIALGKSNAIIVINGRQDF